VENLENIHFSLSNQQELYEKAIEARDEVKMQNIEVDASKKNIDISKSSYYPTLFSHLEYGFNDDKLTTNEDKDYYIALVGLSLTLFDGTRDTQVEKSRIEHLKATLNQEKLKDGIKLEIKKAILDLETKENVLAEKIEARNLASEVLEQAKLQYKNRLISMTILLQQEANYRKYEALLINAKYEKSLALAKVNLVLGKNLKEENE
jgi:outer membrane protein TolC